MMMNQSPRPPLKTPAGMLAPCVVEDHLIFERHAVIRSLGTHAPEKHTLVGEIHHMLVL